MELYDSCIARVTFTRFPGWYDFDRNDSLHVVGLIGLGFGYLQIACKNIILF
jgi:hypothetical protein